MPRSKNAKTAVRRMGQKAGYKPTPGTTQGKRLREAEAAVNARLAGHNAQLSDLNKQIEAANRGKGTRGLQIKELEAQRKRLGLQIMAERGNRQAAEELMSEEAQKNRVLRYQLSTTRAKQLGAQNAIIDAKKKADTQRERMRQGGKKAGREMAIRESANQSAIENLERMHVNATQKFERTNAQLLEIQRSGRQVDAETISRLINERETVSRDLDQYGKEMALQERIMRDKIKQLEENGLPADKREIDELQRHADTISKALEEQTELTNRHKEHADSLRRGQKALISRVDELERQLADARRTGGNTHDLRIELAEIRGLLLGGGSSSSAAAAAAAGGGGGDGHGHTHTHEPAPAAAAAEDAIAQRIKAINASSMSEADKAKSIAALTGVEKDKNPAKGSEKFAKDAKNVSEGLGSINSGLTSLFNPAMFSNILMVVVMILLIWIVMQFFPMI